MRIGRKPSVSHTYTPYKIYHKYENNIAFLRSDDGGFLSLFHTLMTHTKTAVWNADKPAGERIAFTIIETQKIMRALQKQRNHHDYALFCLAVDSLLRGIDLLRLTVADVTDENGEIKDEILWKQKKTKDKVEPFITPATQTALKNWIERSDKRPHDYLFTRTKSPHGSPHIQPNQYRIVVKGWAKLIGLAPDQYSTHSLRRTKPAFLYEYGFSDIATIAEMLGHKDTDTTLRYLGITKSRVKRHALRGDILTREHKSLRKITPLSRDFLNPEFMELFADDLFEQLAPKIMTLFADTIGQKLNSSNFMDELADKLALRLTPKLPFKFD